MKSLQKNRLRVRLYQRVVKLANWIATIPDRVTPPPFRLLQIESAFWQSRALYVATRLGLADALGAQERHTREIAESLGLHEDHLYRLLRMLASIGVFRETLPRTFGNSRLSDYLRRDHPHSLCALILMHHSPVMTRPWMDSLEEGIRSGETPFVKSHGVELFDYMDRDADFDRLFAEAMDAVEALTGDDYLEDFDWSSFERLIDVGGSKGAKALAILARQPHLRAAVLDRAQIIGHARDAWRGKVDASILDRIEFIDCDLLANIPEPQSDRDIYLFMAVFHGLGDEDANKVLTNLRQAIGDLRPGILVVDTVAQAYDIDPIIASLDMQMLIATRGRERTLDEWTALFSGAGFAIQQVIEVRAFARFMLLQPCQDTRPAF